MLLLALRTAAWIVVAVFVCRLLETARWVIAEIPARVEHRIEIEAEATRILAHREIAGIRRDLARELAATRADARQQLRDAVRAADARLAAIQADVAGQLSQANAAAAQAATILPPIQNTLEVISENADLLGRCESNPDCFANRAIGTMRAIERTSRSTEVSSAAVAKAAPETAEAVRSTAVSVQALAKSWEKKTPFYIRAIGWAGKLFIGLKAIF